MKTALELYHEYNTAAPEDRPAARAAWVRAEREQQRVEREERNTYEAGEQQP